MIEDLWEWFKQGLYNMMIDFTTNILTAMDAVTKDMFRSAFIIEDSWGLGGTPLVPITVDEILTIIYGFMIILLVLKLSWQGWKVYILWRDGDAEVSPGQLLLNSCYALIVAVAFPTLYELGIDFALGLADTLMEVFPYKIGAESIFASAADALQRAIDCGLSGSLHLLLTGLLFLFTLVLLSIQMIFRGTSMLIYRWGIPFAATGLVNSDGGIWKSYVQIYFQQLAIVIAQNILVRLSINLCLKSAPDNFSVWFYAAIFIVTAFRMPKILAPILGTTGSGQGATSALMAARMFFNRR